MLLFYVLYYATILCNAIGSLFLFVGSQEDWSVSVPVTAFRLLTPIILMQFSLNCFLRRGGSIHKNS